VNLENVKLFKSLEDAELKGFYSKSKAKELKIKLNLEECHLAEKSWDSKNPKYGIIHKKVQVYSPLITNSLLISSLKKEGERGRNTTLTIPQVLWKKWANIEVFEEALLVLTVQENWTEGLKIPDWFDLNEANWILHRINMGWIFKKQRKVPLKQNYLENIMIKKNVHKYLEFMERNKIIGCDHSFIRKSKCFHYWIGGRIKNNKIVSVPASPRIQKNWENKKIELRKIHEDIKAQMQFITIDEDKALLTCREPSQRYIVEQINKKDFRLEQCQYGRVHTNITNMNKNARKFLKIDGEETVECDISSAMVLLMAKEAKDEQIPQAEEIIALCGSGEFYESFGDKDKVKSQIINQLLFGKVSYMNAKIPQEFKKRYPEIFKWLLNIKKKDYKATAHLFQRAESKIMIDIVGTMLVDQGIHFHPIYDGVLCKKAESGKVAEIMRAAWQSQGITPSIKTSPSPPKG
jgi:hypothetical protein